MTQTRRLWVALCLFCVGSLVLCRVTNGHDGAHAGDGEVWVTSMGTGTVQVVDPASLQVLAVIPAGKGAHNVSLSPDDKLAFVANVGTDNVTIIDAEHKQVLGQVAAGRGAHQVALSPDGKLAVVSNPRSGDITLIDVGTRRALRTLPTGAGAMLGVFMPEGNRVLIGNAGAATISVVDIKTAQVVATWPGGKGMTSIEPLDDWQQAWINAPDDNKVILVDLSSGDHVAELEVAGEPHSLALSDDGKRLYVVQRKLNQLAVIDTATRRIVKTASVGDRPDWMALSADGGTLYVTSRASAQLLAVATDDLRPKGAVGTGLEPHGVAYRRHGGGVPVVATTQYNMGIGSASGLSTASAPTTPAIPGGFGGMGGGSGGMGGGSGGMGGGFCPCMRPAYPASATTSFGTGSFHSAIPTPFSMGGSQPIAAPTAPTGPPVVGAAATSYGTDSEAVPTITSILQIVDRLLEQRKKFHLSPEQQKQLQAFAGELLETAKTVIRNTAAMQIAELERKALMKGETIDLAAADAKVVQLESLRAEIRLADARAYTKAMALLTGEQRQALRDIQARSAPALATTPGGP